MKTLGVLLILGFSFAAAAQDKSVPTPGGGASAEVQVPPDAIFDQGTIEVDGSGGFSRVEDFVIFKTPDGGYTILSNIAADDGSYNASASWTYDKDWHALKASARSMAKGIERKIEMRRDGDTVTMKRRTITKDDIKADDFTAQCGDDCLMDMTPAVLPMSIMARRFDGAKSGPQVFKWVGVSLINDQVLTDGQATISRQKTMKVQGIGEVTHWRFVEDLKGPGGQPFQMNAHLWTDPQGHLRKFGMGRTPQPSTIGVRQTDAAVTAQMPAE
ncbi:MAG: hypothetical protein JNM81_07745 [Rhodospirillaceae bacterium]|nr:hypothetical protein [Rhodospirillaceae bacterium]